MSRVTLGAPTSGWLTSVRDVPDPVFSEEMMGVGVAIDPTEGTLVAPCDAQVLQVAPAKHSVTLRTDEGAELLIHIGLETVALNGRGFARRARASSLSRNRLPAARWKYRVRPSMTRRST